MSPQLEELWLENALASFEKQLHLADVVGERGWEFSMGEGRLVFPGRGWLQKPLSFAAQVLGSESEGDQTWLWAWANQASQIPPNLLQAAHLLRTMGIEDGVPELEEAHFPLEQADGHALAMIATGLLEAGAYYRGPYQGGAIFLLIQDTAFPSGKPDTARVLRVITEGIALLPLGNHRKAISAYLQKRSWTLTDSDAQMQATQGSQLITLKFDESHRLIDLSASLTPQ